MENKTEILTEILRSLFGLLLAGLTAFLALTYIIQGQEINEDVINAILVLATIYFPADSLSAFKRVITLFYKDVGE